MNDRLIRFASLNACGQWNSAIVDDFRYDPVFIRDADDLFRDAVSIHFKKSTYSSDGLELVTVAIEPSVSIKIYFKLHFLVAPNGYRSAPGLLSIATDFSTNKRRTFIHCGLRDPEGDFWIPNRRNAFSVVMCDNYSWAFSRERTYLGDASLLVNRGISSFRKND